MMRRCKTRKQPLILIVDDDATTLELMRSILEKEGLLIETVDNGAEAVTVFECLKPDMVILDVVMPEMDGHTTCREIRKMPDGDLIPILMVTGLEDMDSINRAYEAGTTDFITKPINWALFSRRAMYMLRSSEATRKLRERESQLAKVQRIAQLGHWEWCIEEDKLECSEETYRIFGTGPQEFGNRYDSFMYYVHPDDKDVVQQAMDKALTGHQPFNIEHRILLKNGEEQVIHQQAETVMDETGNVVQMIGTVQEITERKRSEDQIRYLAYYDNLTDLPNRTFFKEHLGQALKESERNKRIMGVMFLDLDYFKRINDTLGHNAGDQLLKDVGRRLMRCVRTNDIVSRPSLEGPSSNVSRLGGDEFTFLLTEIKHIQDAARVARRILASLSDPFNLNGQEIFITASIGIAISPDDGDCVDTLLKNADTAMYHAKSQGRNNYQFYTKSMNAASFERLTLENSLRKALEREEFILYYQPLLDIHTLAITAGEALIRWKHPDMGLVPPGDFIPLAEETGLIVSIGEWVLNHACRQNKILHDQGFDTLRISVNLSHRQFEQDDLSRVVIHAVETSGLDPEFLELELTESTTMQNIENTIATLQTLKQIKIGLSIDDFGTGYSSLSCLKRFPLDVLKVDRNFVRHITTDPDQAAITKAIIAMAQTLKLRVVAEGVETEEQLNYLRELGCDQVQGFLFSPPVPVKEFTDLLKAESPFHPAPLST